MPEHESQSQEFSFKSYFVPFTTIKAIHFIIVIGLIVFFNSLFNGFVLEDRAEIIRDPSVQSITNIPNLFIHQVGGQESIDYYRPLLFTFYDIFYSLFQQNTFPYHLFQVIIQITNTVLIFLILKKYIKIELAFFLALVFLVHPINEESVVWITDLQEVLYMFFGLLSVYLLQREKINIKTFIIVNLSLLFSIFSKETGILFFAVTSFYLYLFKKSKLMIHLSFSFLAIIIYAILRLVSQTPLQKEDTIPIMILPLWQRMINVPAMIFYYIKTFFYPANLVVYHSWVIKTIQFNTFFLPLLIDCLFFLVLFSMCIFVIKKGKEKKLILLFSAWFIIGLIFHLQIIPLDFTVADHFFIFSFVAFLAIIGLFLQHIHIKKLLKQLFVALAILILCALSARTMVRNTNWSDQSTILAHDEKSSPNDYLLELVYSTDLIQQNKISEALPHVKEAIELYPQASDPWNSLGVIYFERGDIQDAKKAFLHSISIGGNYQAYENYGLLEKEHDTPINALNFLRKATELNPNSWKLWYYRFIVAYKMGNTDEALLCAKNYFLLNENTQSYALYTHLLNKQPVKID